MKNYTILFITLFFLLIISCQPSTEDAIKYQDGIIEQQVLLNEKFSELISSYDSYVADEMDAAYKLTLDQLNKGIEYVSKTEGFEQEAYFKEGALAFFNSYKEVLENEHKKIIELLKLPEDSYGHDEIKEVQMLRDRSNIKIDKAFEDMLAVQKKFTKKYHIEME